MRSLTNAAAVNLASDSPVPDCSQRTAAAAKRAPFTATELDEEVREELAEPLFTATLQSASTFMNAIRVRLSAAERAGGGGARVGGSYSLGTVFHLRVLISLLKISRVHYNFFELRAYASPYEERSPLHQGRL
jgi:hypothetical protein